MLQSTERALSRLSLAEAAAQGPLLHLRKRGGGALAAQLSHVASLASGTKHKATLLLDVLDTRT